MTANILQPESGIYSSTGPGLAFRFCYYCFITPFPFHWYNHLLASFLANRQAGCSAFIVWQQTDFIIVTRVAHKSIAMTLSAGKHRRFVHGLNWIGIAEPPASCTQSHFHIAQMSPVCGVTGWSGHLSSLPVTSTTEENTLSLEIKKKQTFLHRNEHRHLCMHRLSQRTFYFRISGCRVTNVLSQMLYRNKRT